MEGLTKFGTFMILTDIWTDKYPTNRTGQAMMNVMRTYDPDLYEEITERWRDDTAQQIDPFYVDSRIYAFLEYIRAHWNEQTQQ